MDHKQTTSCFDALRWEEIWNKGKEGVKADGTRCRCVVRQKQQDKWLKDIFCSCAPRESKKPFFLGIIKDELGQKVGDEEEGTTRCQINVPLLHK